MTFEELGVLEIPVPLKKVGQILLWVASGSEGACPLDLSFLPPEKPSLKNLQKGDSYYLFSSVKQTEENLVLVYKRFVTLEEGIKDVQNSSSEEDLDVFYWESQKELYNTYQVMIDTAFLRVLREGHQSLRTCETPEDFVRLIQSEGFLGDRVF
jgi:hypothetical protein